MPELPDLEAILRFLHPRITGLRITGFTQRNPLTLRALTDQSPVTALMGQRIEAVRREGKYLVLHLTDWSLAIHPMLTGLFAYVPSDHRIDSVTAFQLALEDGHELRYLDSKTMGKAYLIHRGELEKIPQFSEQGPDALDPALTREAFVERLLRQRAEIKNTLRNARFVQGIGNAYSDEILFEARVNPFRKSSSLSPAEAGAVYDAMRSVLADAIPRVEAGIGDDLTRKVRDFLQVHGKGGRPCPRCGGRIATVLSPRGATNFCRQCQPGLLIDVRRSRAGSIRAGR